MSVTGKTVDLGDDESGAVDLAGRERLLQRRPIVVVLAALDLDMLLDQLPTAAVEERLDRMALGFEAEAACARTLGADAQIADELAVMLNHCLAPSALVHIGIANVIGICKSIRAAAAVAAPPARSSPRLGTRSNLWTGAGWC